MRVCHRPSAPVVAVAAVSPISTRTASPGCDHPQMTFGLPRWSTMWSPKIGLTNGSGLASWGGAPKALPVASVRAATAGKLKRKRFALTLMNCAFIFVESPCFHYPGFAMLMLRGLRGFSEHGELRDSQRSSSDVRPIGNRQPHITALAGRE